MNDQKLTKALKISGLVFCSLIVCISLFGCLLIYGPFETLRSTWVNRAMSSFRYRRLAESFFSPEYISLVTDNQTPITDGEPSESEPNDTQITPEPESSSESEPASSESETGSVPPSDGMVAVEDVSRRGEEGYFVGYMMLVNDPSLLHLVIAEDPYQGETLLNINSRMGALAGINAVGVAAEDSENTSTGYIIKDGNTVQSGTSEESHNLIGIDGSGHLILKRVTNAEIGSCGLSDAVEVDSFLIVDGQAANVGITEIGPRSAIGQRADGGFLLLVIDGRSTVSLGASEADVISIMKEYGAINCAGLDGGDASSLVLDGKIISKPSSGASGGKLAAAFIVSEQVGKESEE